ncbi:glycosyltransferase family 2 protein [Rhodovulum sp. 12E13]|uniref:glycosyltransferase family 2 protein n=1 Tax=Rhodovulum sp. 12E13 TaxID=2203891 RepID=UPI000E19BD15|nr:glycosyltransferase family 2 protein [Rhodovulum sp. 12E13]RDC72829.1 glycosyltransferase family 2 protein [Rhodovulum sp. 12E13]
MTEAGEILALDTGYLYGWATLPGSTAPPVIEVLVDGLSAAVAPADLDAAALAPLRSCNGLPAGAFAFAIPLPADLVKCARRIEARLANTALWLDGALTVGLAPALRWTHGLLGHVASDGGARITGWALDPRRPHEPLALSVHVDGLRMATVTADRHDPWLAKRGIGSGFHGFEIDLPTRLLDGTPHLVMLEAEVDGGPPLPVPGSPVEICHLPARLADLVPEGPARAIADWYDLRFARELPEAVAAELACVRPPVAPPAEGALRIAATTPGRGDVARQTFSAEADPAEADILVRLHPDLRLTDDAFAALAQAFAAPETCLVTADHLRGEPPVVHDGGGTDPLRWWAQGLPPLLAWRHTARGAAADPARFALERPAACTHLSLALGTLAPGVGPEPAETPPPPCLVRRPCAGAEPPRLAPAAGAGGLVSIVIPTRDKADLLAACVDSIVDDVQSHEIVIVDNGSVERATEALYDRLRADPRVRILPWDKPFNFADLCNAGAKAARGETLLFLNNDVVFPEPGWIGPLAAWLTVPGIGAVGTKLVWPNEIVQHGGVRIGPQGLADHIGTTWWRDEAGPDDLNRIPRLVDAVTAACLAIPARLFHEIGGFDGHRFAVAFNDVELCIRVQEAGRRIVWTPEPWAWHHESASRGDDDLPHKRARMEREARFLRARVAEWQAARRAGAPDAWKEAG